MPPPARRITPFALVAVLVIVTAACSGPKASTTSERVTGSTAASPSALGVPAADAAAGGQLSAAGAPITTVPGAPAGQAGLGGTAGQTGLGGTAGQAGLGGTVAAAQVQVVRNANVVVDVSRGNVPSSYDAVANLATANGGFVADSNLSTAQGSAPTGRLTLRIPVDHLSAVLTALNKLGKVAQQDQQGADVTGQLVDLGARIKSLQAEEDATRILLGRAQAIGDILQIQGQLFNLRTQIEQLAGQQSQLSDKATYATVAVQVVEAGPALSPPTPPKPKPTLVRAWTIAGHNIVAVVDAAALALGWLAPLLVVALLALPALLWWRRRIGPDPAPTQALAD